MFYFREIFLTGSFTLSSNSNIFLIILNISFKMLEFNPLKKPRVKHHLIFFFCNFIIYFLEVLEVIYTKVATQFLFISSYFLTRWSNKNLTAACHLKHLHHQLIDSNFRNQYRCFHYLHSLKIEQILLLNRSCCHLYCLNHK